jgi:hypothetical protein
MRSGEIRHFRFPRYNPWLVVTRLAIRGLLILKRQGADPWDILDRFNKAMGLPIQTRHHFEDSYQKFRNEIPGEITELING